MATIPQQSLFSWQEIDACSDLDRLHLVLSALPDEELMCLLEQYRGKGRNDYPVRVMWNTVLAGVVFQHPSIASLRRELLRNAELRQCCGYDVCRGARAVPPAHAFSRFLTSLQHHEPDIRAMFDRLVEQLRKELPDLGVNLGVDGKAIDSAGKKSNKARDGRRDTDADWGTKSYRGQRSDGSPWSKVRHWFGYNLHLLIDADYELPLGYTVTQASVNDTTQLLPLVAELKDNHPAIVHQAQTLSGDRGYDSQANNQGLYDNYQIAPIIDIRHDWKDGETTRPLDPERVDVIVYDQDGTPFCAAGQAADEPMMPLAYDGFEKQRGTLKYRCPAAVYGLDCPERARCGSSAYGRVVRIPLDFNRRRFIPVPRSSYKFKRLYKKRTAVERVNSRLDVSFGFERHFIRGQLKMQVQVGLALVVMLAMALGRIRQGQAQQMRSLVGAAWPRAA